MRNKFQIFDYSDTGIYFQQYSSELSGAIAAVVQQTLNHQSPETFYRKGGALNSMARIRCAQPLQGRSPDRRTTLVGTSQWSLTHWNWFALARWAWAESPLQMPCFQPVDRDEEASCMQTQAQIQAYLALACQNESRQQAVIDERTVFESS